MPTKKPGGIADLVSEVEKIAKRLRVEIRRAARTAGVERTLRAAARNLRHRAADVAEQVEKYAHEIRVELAGAPRRTRPRAKKRVASKRVA